MMWAYHVRAEHFAARLTRLDEDSSRHQRSGYSMRAELGLGRTWGGLDEQVNDGRQPRRQMVPQPHGLGLQRRVQGVAHVTQ